jgi:sphingolipid delta-4 desaturase
MLNDPGKMSFLPPPEVPPELPREGYVFVEERHPHTRRARAILKDHPEVKKLFGSEPRSIYWGLFLVATQLTVAVAIRDWTWLPTLVLAYVFGAVIHHALWVLTHEACHNLIFPRANQNRWFSLVLNLPQVVPSAISFRKYHLLHHSHQGHYDYDADITTQAVANDVGSSWWRKLLYMVFFSFAMGAVNPSRLKTVKFLDKWTVINAVVQISFVALFWKSFGGWSLFYLGASTFFSLGLHPMGGRWIAEHYLVEEHQETNSYYGPLNKLSFNMGYHNEHHDFCRVPWTRLPELKQTAPEYYDGLFAYSSWTYALWRFITDREVTLFDRIARRTEENSTSDSQS